MATQTSHTEAPLTKMDFEPPNLTPSEMKKKDEMDAVDVNAEQEKGHTDTPLMEMNFEPPSLTPNDMKKKDKMDAVDVTTKQEKDFAMATQTSHTEAHLTEMDFVSPNLTPSEMKKKDKMDAVDVNAEQEKAEADIKRKVTDLLAAGDERRDARLSYQQEFKLEDVLMKDLFVEDSDGKKSAFHEKKAREHGDCHLGGGSFGEVFKAVHTVHGEVAVKVAKPGKEDRVVMYQKEAGKHVLALTSHRIVAIRGFVQCDDGTCHCGLIGIVMEYMKRGSLWDFRFNEWEDRPDLWPLTNRMVYQISSGMHFLHSKNIIHRDLKSENVLIDAQLNAKIADLGLATNLQTSSGDKCWGTNSHKPPEAFRTDLPSSTKIVTKKYDVYSFGMTLYELLTGIHPYSDHFDETMKLLKLDKKTPCLDPVPSKTPDELKQIMIESWSYERNHRPKFGDITERVGELDTDPTYESLGHYLGKSRSSKKGGKAASPVSERELPANNNRASMRKGIGNLTVQDQAPAKGHGNTNTSVPAAKTVVDHESLERKMGNLTVNADGQTEPRNKKTTVPLTETVKQHLVEGHQSLPTHLGPGTVGAQPVRHHSEPNRGQCEASSPHVLPRPHDSSLGRSPNPATGAVSQGTPGNLSQFGCAVRGSKKDDVQPVTERPVPQEPTQEPRFRSLKSKPENDDSLQTLIGAGQSMDFKGLESAPTTDPPGPSANKPLRSYMEHDKYQGPDPKYGYAPNASVGSKQEAYSHNFHSQPKAEHLNPYPYGHNKPANGRPVPVDSPHGTTEYAVGHLPGGPIHQESPAAMPSQPSSTERDPVIIFDSAQLTDEDFEIKLHVNVTIPVRASIIFKLEEIISSHKRSKHRAYWQNSNSLHATLISHETTLRTLHLPPTVDEDCFTLLLRVSNKAALEKLHSFSKKGLLPQMLFPFFVDRHLEDLCSPVKPDLKVESWEDQFNKGIAHFKKKEKAKSRSKKTKQVKSGAPFTHEKEEATLTKSSSSGTTQIDKGNVRITMTGAPKNFVFGNQYYNHTHYHGVGGAGGGTGGGDGFYSFSHQTQKKPKKPKLSGSKEKVSTTLLLEISDVIFEKDVKSLGRHLGLREVEVDNLVYSHRGERSSEIAYQVLNEWLQRNGQRASKAVLAEALWKAKCYDAAESVQ